MQKPGGNYLVEQTSEEAIEVGIVGDQRISAYHHYLFFSLERQRVELQQAIAHALRSSVRRKPYSICHWARIVDAKFQNEPLSARGSTMSFGQRFNIGKLINLAQYTPFPALYIGRTHNIAFCEKYGVSADKSSQLSNQELGLGVSLESHQCVFLAGKINSIIDIRTTAALQKLARIFSQFEIDDKTNELAILAKIKPWEIIGKPNDLKRMLHDQNWSAAPTQVNLPANPQIFGKLTYDSGIEGILYNSTKGLGSCLALFPTNFNGSESYLAIEDEMPKSVQVTTLDRNTWRDLI